MTDDLDYKGIKFPIIKKENKKIIMKRKIMFALIYFVMKTI